MVNARGNGQGARRKDTHPAAARPWCVSPCPSRGFTLVELLVVLSIIALLLSIATPRYFRHVERSKEVVLRENLATLRDALDQYHADKGVWPDSLETLAQARYLRAVPIDPITGRNDTWVTEAGEEGAGVSDVISGAPGADDNGKAYAEW